jgi:hypothetical protein
MASQTPIEAALLHCSAAAVETMTEECVQKSAWAIAGQVAEMLLPYDRKVSVQRGNELCSCIPDSDPQ